MMMEWVDSPHAAYIIAAYGLSVLVLGGMHFYVWHSLRRLTKKLAADDAD
jgi:cytochrome oxidase assembly protein ShyY1